MRFRNCRALVTGGLGFIGSSLAIRLAREGARVTIVDSCIEGCGANPHNIDGVLNIEIIQADIGQPDSYAIALRSTDIVFNLAGEISHIGSMRSPGRDLYLNTTSQLNFLEACRQLRPGIRIVYASTRQVYGIPQYLPVDERHSLNPIDYNGVHKVAAGQYHLMLSRIGALDAILLRLTNVYGPRMSLTAPHQGFISAFVRTLMQGGRLKIFGDGIQLRDPLYVDDAVEAFLLAALIRNPSERIFNIGGPEHLELGEIAQIASRLALAPPPSQVPFPADLKPIDIGSYFTDSTLFWGETGWRPYVRFEEGFDSTLKFFRAELPHYLNMPVPVT